MNKPIDRLIEAARGDRPVDLLICNGRLVNVYNGRVDQIDIAVADGYVVGFGAYDARKRIDIKGHYVAPGFIDSHVHIESAMVGPAEFARAVLPHGTVAVVADPHEIANVWGAEGIAYMLAASEEQPVRFYFALPSCVPATAMETAGAVLQADDLAAFMGHERVKALGEMMNYPGVIHGDSDVLAKIRAIQSHDKPMDGHSPGLSGKALNAYLSAGIASDHECTTADEAREKLAAGMYIMVREGTGARNLDDLLPVIDGQTSRRMMWCTDDRHPHDLLEEGHIDGMVRRAIAKGLDPITAIQMATLNPAEYFRLDNLGAVAPGKRADLAIFEDLNAPVIRQVYVKGQMMIDGGRFSGDLPQARQVPAPAGMNVAEDQLDFKIAAQGRRMRVIEVVPDQIVTLVGEAEPQVIKGEAVVDVEHDLLKLVVVERHRGTGRRGIGFVHGFGLKMGALASSVAHDSHNIVAVGTQDEALRFAVQCLVDMGGGLVAVHDGHLLAKLALPIAGLMSDQPIHRVRDRLDALLAAARQLGSPLPDPFMTLSFMALPVIPSLKLTDMGLVDVDQFKFVPLFLE